MSLNYWPWSNLISMDFTFLIYKIKPLKEFNCLFNKYFFTNAQFIQVPFVCARDLTIKNKGNWLLTCSFIPVGREHSISIVITHMLHSELNDKCYADNRWGEGGLESWGKVSSWVPTLNEDELPTLILWVSMYVFIYFSQEDYKFQESRKCIIRISCFMLWRIW